MSAIKTLINREVAIHNPSDAQGYAPAYAANASETASVNLAGSLTGVLGAVKLSKPNAAGLQNRFNKTVYTLPNVNTDGKWTIYNTYDAEAGEVDVQPPTAGASNKLLWRAEGSAAPTDAKGLSFKNPGDFVVIEKINTQWVVTDWNGDLIREP